MHAEPEAYVSKSKVLDHLGLVASTIDMLELIDKEGLRICCKISIARVPRTSKNPVPKYGFSKQHRPDLKQMILNIAITNTQFCEGVGAESR